MGSGTDRVRGDARRDESEHERLDRNLMELLQELRVAQTGVQILFAFLLTLPFTERFGEVTDFQRDVYLFTLVLAGAASLFLIAPVSYHRLVFRQGDKDELVFDANRLALVGLACLALAILSAVFLIVDVLFQGPTVAAVVGGLAVIVTLTWLVLPLARRGA